jgi:outer membrane biosynthesis protein TonB
VRRLQSALLLIESERKRSLHELGAAAHARDSSGEAAARARLRDLDRQEATLRSQLESQLRLAGERIRKAKLPVQDTMMVLPTEPLPTEPGPPPGEATPPQPAVVPEPYPPPDEGNPPEPARIPEPTPDEPRRED